MVFWFILILSSIIFLYSFVKIYKLEKFYKNAKSSEDFNEGFIGAVLLCNRRELLSEISFFYDLYKRMKSRENDVMVVVYNQELSKNDIKLFERLHVKFIPSIIITKDNFTYFKSYKLEEY